MIINEEMITRESFDDGIIRNINNLDVNIDDFGAVGDCVKMFSLSSNPDEVMEMSGNDDTEAFQNAVNYCIANKKRLILNGSKKYRIRDTIIIDGQLSIEGNYCHIYADIEDKSKPLFLIKNNSREKISNMHLVGNYLCKAGIEFQSPDNQMLTIRNIDVAFFRYGIYTNQPEDVNRMIIDRCEIMNNLLCGIYLKQAEVSSSNGQSVPFRINDTLVHTNGFGSGTETGYVNKIKILTDEKRSDIYQIYLVGIGNCLITGGQLTAGSDKGTGALLWGHRVSQLTMIDVETEQFWIAKENSKDMDSNRDKMNSADFKNLIGGHYGGAIHIQNSQNVNIQVNGAFDLHSDCFVKLVNCYRVASIKNCYKGDDVVYLVDIIDSNYNNKPIGGSNQLRLETNCDLNDLSPSALFATNQNKFSLLTNIGYILPHCGGNYHFTNADIINDRYVIKSTDFNNPNFENTCSIIKVYNNPSVALLVLDMRQYNSEGNGRFFIEWLDKDNKRLGYKIVNTNEGWKSQVGDSKYIKRIAIYFTEIEKIHSLRYGFVTNDVDSLLDDGSTMRIFGFKLFVGDNTSVSQWTNGNNVMHDGNYSQGFINNNMIAWGNQYPRYGYHNKGEIVFNTNASSGSNVGWICVESGNYGVWKTFGIVN